jgi:hypothetical protein
MPVQSPVLRSMRSHLQLRWDNGSNAGFKRFMTVSKCTRLQVINYTDYFSSTPTLQGFPLS